MKPSAVPLHRLLLGSLLLLAVPYAAHAEAHTCALLQPADLTPLLAKPGAGKANGPGCTWSGAGGKKLIVSWTRPAVADLPRALAEARKESAEDPGDKVTDETGIGEKAFSVRSSFGVALIALKGGRLINFMFMAGAPGTEKDLAAMRQVARKAVAAF